MNAFSTFDSNLQLRSMASVWHPCTIMRQHENYPLIPITRGQGIWLYDNDNNRYLDGISSWWVNLFGHCNADINAALRDQLERLEHVMLAGFTHEPVVELSERLAHLTPGSLGHCFYASDGASATEIALKISFHYWQLCGKPQKTNFISLQNGYHGETLGALSVTDVAIFKQIYAPILRQCETVPTPDWRYAEAGESHAECALRAAKALEYYLEQHHKAVAAFILEPLIQGAAGMGMYHPLYLQCAREICSQYQVHLIADEIAVGFGRAGTLFACEQANIVPDFLCLAKGLSGGYLPLSVTMISNEIYQIFYREESHRTFLHSHSHTGNALACRAALATLNLLEQNDVIQTNRNKAEYLNKIALPLATHPKIKNFRNCGMIWAFEFETEDPEFSVKFFQAALKQQLLLRPLGKTVYFMPPYIINEQEMDLLVNGTLTILNKWSEE